MLPSSHLVPQLLLIMLSTCSLMVPALSPVLLPTCRSFGHSVANTSGITSRLANDGPFRDTRHCGLILCCIHHPPLCQPATLPRPHVRAMARKKLSKLVVFECVTVICLLSPIPRRLLARPARRYLSALYVRFTSGPALYSWTLCRHRRS